MTSDAEDVGLRLTILEARVDQLAGLLTRCCSRIGVVPSDGFDEHLLARMDEQQEGLAALRGRFDAIERELKDGIQAYLRIAQNREQTPSVKRAKRASRAA